MGLGSTRAETRQDEDAEADLPAYDLPTNWIDEDASPTPRRFLPIAATALALVLVLGWLALVGYATRVSIRSSGDRLLDLFALLPVASAPVALIGVIWLLAQRTSRREARRFGSTAAAMRIEAANMEAVLARLGVAIDANRRLLADQADQLLALGEEAAGRLGRVRQDIASEGAMLGRHTEALSAAAGGARIEMTTLMADLPRAETQSRELAALLRDAGHTAHEQAGALALQVGALTRHAKEADETAGGAAQRLAAHLAGIETHGAAAARQLGDAARALRTQVDEALAAAGDALGQARTGLDAQGAATLALIDQSRAALERVGADAATALGERLDGAAARLETLGRRLVEQDSASRALVAKLEAGLAAVDERLVALDESGRTRTAALEQAVGTLRGQAERAILAVGDGSEAADKLVARAETLRAAIDAVGREIDSLPPSLDRVDEAAQRSRTMIASAAPEVARFEAVARFAADRLGKMQANVGDQQALVDRLGETVTARIGEIEAHGRALADIEGRFANFGDAGAERTADLAEAIVALSGHAHAITQTFGASVGAAETLTLRVATLEEALSAVRGTLDQALPGSIAEVQGSADRARASLAAAIPEAASVERAVERAVSRIGEVDEAAARRRAAIATAGEEAEARLARLATALDTMRDGIAAIGAEAGDVAESAAPKLIDALLRVREMANTAAAAARETLAGVVPAAAHALGDAAHEAIATTVTARVEEQMQVVADASERAVTAAHRATDRLMRQMLTIADTTSAVEARIEEAHGQIAQRDEDGFSRRTALLIESLNSTAIDVAKIFSTEVTDAAWSAYLRGDRGVFTRRAVRLLDASGVREVARAYEDQPDFREQVNRYIHDFEAMLRRVLASRDGAPMSVTLLSSDMGKLYVALAQAIERLRA